MVKVFMGVLVGIFLTLATIQIWNLFFKSTAAPATNVQLPVIQSSPAPLAIASPLPSPPVVQDYASFVAYIKTLGLGVGAETKAHSDLYAGNITEVLINNETMYVIEYASETEMTQRASEISPDSTQITRTLPDGTKQITSILRADIPTHYYKKGRIIVIYAGKNETIIQILEEIFGPQFAGHE